MKYRRHTVSRSYTEAKALAYASVASFDAAYGDIGAGVMDSCLGSFGLAP